MMMAEEEEEVWFQLVNRRGAPITPLKSVALSSTSSVDTFRIAAFPTFCFRFPAHLTASNLKVFANRAAYQNETPLKVSEPLGNWGKDPGDPLLVEIPKVWFRLVDAGTRETLAGTREYSAPLTEESNARALRGIVLEMLLPHTPTESPVEARRLQIFKSRQAYDEKKAMGEDDQIGSSGKTKQSALIVEVPSFPATDPASELGSRKMDQIADALGTESPPKRPRLLQSRLAPAGPVFEGYFSVPLESIAAFQTIKQGFSDTTSLERPLILLYGPRQYGKTTIAYGIETWLAAEVPDVMCVSIELLGIVDGPHLWQFLGDPFDTQSTCSDSVSFLNAVESFAARTKKRVCLIVDGLDCLSVDGALVGGFLALLRELKVTSCFYGFLGVGSSALARHHELGSDNPSASLHAEIKLLQAETLSTMQMAAFFELIEPCFNFARSLRQAIMEYSGGAPGVFGSLVRYTATHTKWTKESREWEPWFKLTAFSDYLLHNNAYFCINKELCGLTALEWRALRYVLQTEDANVTAEDLQTLCGGSIKSGEKIADKLQDMGILVQATDGKLSVVSEMVHRICVQALPERDDVQAIENAGDPLVLLSAAVRWMRAEVIADFVVGNDTSPTVAAFHQELFCTMRDILKETQRFTRDGLEAWPPSSLRRADIIVADARVRFGFEVKVGLLDEAEVVDAVRQADAYRVYFSVQQMFLVNFMIPGHRRPGLNGVKEFPEVKLVHVRFDETCNTFHSVFSSCSSPRRIN